MNSIKVQAGINANHNIVTINEATFSVCQTPEGTYVSRNGERVVMPLKRYSLASNRPSSRCGTKDQFFADLSSALQA